MATAFPCDQIVKTIAHRFQITSATVLYHVVIPDSVTVIEKDEYKDHRNIVSVTIPLSVTTIGESAFSGCRKLKSIEIPNTVTIIEESTFQDCRALASVVLPNSITRIGESAFTDCSINPNSTLGRNDRTRRFLQVSSSHVDQLPALGQARCGRCLS